LIKKTFIRLPFDILNVEFLTHIPGEISFSDSYKKAENILIENISVKVISLDHFIINKKATNRPKDLNDIIELEKRNPKN
jgi:hypothetical protein